VTSCWRLHPKVQINTSYHITWHVSQVGNLDLQRPLANRCKTSNTLRPLLIIPPHRDWLAFRDSHLGDADRGPRKALFDRHSSKNARATRERGGKTAPFDTPKTPGELLHRSVRRTLPRGWKLAVGYFVLQVPSNSRSCCCCCCCCYSPPSAMPNSPARRPSPCYFCVIRDPYSSELRIGGCAFWKP